MEEMDMIERLYLAIMHCRRVPHAIYVTPGGYMQLVAELVLGYENKELLPDQFMGIPIVILDDNSFVLEG
jgi:NADH:ubiquinone oxidoreductase subunit H